MGGVAMGCMRCGRDVPGEQAFCEDCLLEMEKYPVKPGTAVMLPIRKETPAARKQSRRKVLPPEEQVKVLKRRVRGLTITLILTLLLAAALAIPAYQHLMEDHFLPGQNYSTFSSKTEPTEVPEAPNPTP